jgi:hypothetical protein
MNVDKVQARKMVLVSCFALILISVYRNRGSETQGDTFRRLWATGVVAFLLSLLADFAPTIAGPFAVLTVLGWVVKDGTAIVDSALGTGAGASPAGPVTSTARTGPNTQTTVTKTPSTTTVSKQTGP